MRTAPVNLDAAVARADEEAAAVAESLASRKTSLPLRYWRQQAHFTTPAERDIASKALAGGTEPMIRILDRFEVSPAELAHHLGADEAAVEALLSEPRPAPLVMVDAEDALANTDAAIEQARIDAVEVLSSPRPGPGQAASLRFFRPPGLDLGTTARELYSLLWGLVERHGPDALPLDGVVFPKVEHPEEIDLLHGMLSAAEKELGIAEGTVRTAYLIESGWAAAQLSEISRRAADRLCALVFGLADYSADLGLADISTDHPLADWARATIINVAAGVGVPAIDGMTLAYPVADRSLDAPTNRTRFLDRMALVYSDAVRARDMGLAGKWVGHPAQLFAVLLAYDAAFAGEALEHEAEKLMAYSDSVHGEGKGATMIAGVMSDRATDRHARVRLRQATALGHFDAGRALAAGVIDEDEFAEATGGSTAQGVA